MIKNKNYLLFLIYADEMIKQLRNEEKARG